jgi:hypothetical protein
VTLSKCWNLPLLSSLHLGLSVCDSTSGQERRHTGILAPAVVLENPRLGKSKRTTSMHVDVAKYRVYMEGES